MKIIALVLFLQGQPYEVVKINYYITEAFCNYVGQELTRNTNLDYTCTDVTYYGT
jgi:hypothetical protein